MTIKNQKASNIYVPISLGELIDKITILEIKKLNMIGIKLKNVKKELQLLKSIIQDQNLKIDINLINDLKNINNKLWEIEDRIRIKDSLQIFDEEFIELAKAIYIENDKRAAVKKEINQKYNSGLIEEKSYKK